MKPLKKLRGFFISGAISIKVASGCEVQNGDLIVSKV